MLLNALSYGLAGALLSSGWYETVCPLGSLCRMAEALDAAIAEARSGAANAAATTRSLGLR
jgi:hypothetical protein